MNKVDSKLMTSGLSSLYNPNKVYSLGELCRTENNGVIQVWEWYSNVESLAGKNPLDEANRQVGWTDETKPYYWTPAKSARAGTVLFPWLSETFPEGTLSVAGNSVPTAVFWRLAEAFPELISGDNIDFPDTGGEFFRVLDQGRGVNAGRQFGSWESDLFKSHSHNQTVFAGNDINFGLLPMGTDDQYGVAHTSHVHAAGGSETRPRNLAFPILVEV